MAELRLIREHELPALLALYRHLHEQDDPLPADEVVQATWRELLASPRYRYVGAYVDEGGGWLPVAISRSSRISRAGAVLMA